MSASDLAADLISGSVTSRRMRALLGEDGASRTSTGTSTSSKKRSREDTLHTRLTREYQVRFPFVGAGMGFVSMPPLVAAVTNAGGIGILGNAIEPPPSTQALIRMVKTLTTGLFGVNFVNDESAFGPTVTDAHFDVCVMEGVELVVFHIQPPRREWVSRLHEAGAKVWMQAGSVEVAVAAVDAGVDAIIAQGSQAGGHNNSSTPMLELLPMIVDAVNPLMVLAAGGIADGASVVGALAHGAEGVVVGTRLVASTEAHAHPEYKRRITKATGEDVVTTTMFGPEYPNKRYRVLRNRVVDEFAGREEEIPSPPPPPAIIGSTVLSPLTFPQPYEMPKFSAIVPTPETVGDLEEMGLPAGSDSVRVIEDVKPAAQIVAEMMADARRLIERGLRASKVPHTGIGV